MLLHLGQHRGLKGRALLRQQFREGPARYQAAQHRFRGGPHNLVHLIDLKSRGVQVDDAIPQARLHLDEIAVAGNHDRLVGDAFDAVVAVRTGPGQHVRGTPGSPFGIEPKTDLHGANSIGTVAHHVFDRPRPAPVQSRAEVRGGPAEAAQNRLLIRLDDRQATDA